MDRLRWPTPGGEVGIVRSALGFVGRMVLVALVVAGIVAIGYGWKHSPAASVVVDDRQRQAATGNASFNRVPDRARDRGNHGLSFGNFPDLAQTLFVEGALVGGVVFIDLRLRARRRERQSLPNA